MSKSKIDLDAELSRFEREISSCTVAAAPAAKSKPAFIPNSIRRQIPPSASSSGSVIQRSAIIEAKPVVHATFVPAGVSSSPTLYNNINNNAQQYTVTPMAVPTLIHTVTSTSGPASTSVASSTSTSGVKKTKNKTSGSKKPKKNLRVAGGQVWEDPTLEEWDSNDFRIFCGDLGNDVNDDILVKAFNRFPSFVKAKVVRDKKTNKSRGYGFVSFSDPLDFSRAIKEMDGKYVGSRPIKLRKSNWKDRNVNVVKQKQKIKQKLGLF